MERAHSTGVKAPSGLTGAHWPWLRGTAAVVMLSLSRLVTIAPPDTIIDEELARELNRRFGRPAFPVTVPKTDYGVAFAFGTPRPGEATGFTAAERGRIEEQMGKTIADLELAANALFEYWLLDTLAIESAPWLAPARVTLDLYDFWHGHHQVTVEVQPDEVRPADP